jgi:hypothetical protein
MSNLLEAIFSISQFEELTVDQVNTGNNRATNMGDGLETFVKKAFSDMLAESDPTVLTRHYQNIFSYEGSATTPPDLMIRGGAAIEVKKTQTISSELQLNSSHPKSKLLSSSPLINNHCRDCEVWSEKDFLYVIGHIPAQSKSLSSIWFIDGSIYAADETTYTNLKQMIANGIGDIPAIDFARTRELGRVNGVDPLRITNLRVRGMWLLQPPFRVFSEVHRHSNQSTFECISIIPTAKYDAFPTNSKRKIEATDTITIEDIEIKNPNNPMSMVACKLIKFVIV